MLNSLCNINSNLGIVTIIDNISAPADDILNAISAKYIKSNKSFVYYVSTEQSHMLNDNQFSNIKFIDACSLPAQCRFQPLSIKKLLKFEELTQSDVVIFDAINAFLWGNAVHVFAAELVKLSRIVQRIILRIHQDVLIDKNDAAQLNRLVKNSCNIEVIEGQDSGFIVRVTQGHPVKRNLEFCQVDEKGELISEVYVKKLPSSAARIVPMDTLTTFDLGVNMRQSEKDARDRLVLPYLRTSEDLGATIEYEADEADLEEDPDDDLEL